MDVTCIIFAVLTQFRFTLSAHVSGTITENTTFFYRKLPVAPSVRATIEFNVSYLKNSTRFTYPLMGIYTQYPKINIEKRCSYIRYGQFRNENLHPHLRFSRPYRTTTCHLSGSDTVNCRGRAEVQDYIPRNFYLTFGSYCKWSRINSLQGLTYEISLTKQSNSTSRCMEYDSHLNRDDVCIGFYRQTSLPNLIGSERLKDVQDSLYVIQTYQLISFSNERCHQHLMEILCHLMLPECNPITQQVIHLCRETCLALSEACLHKWYSLSIDLGLIKDEKYRGNWSRLMNCDYLPSFYSSIPCFYKPVMCDSPPYVSFGVRTLNTTHKDVYQLHDVVQYTCLNESFQMIGTNSITCLYSGRWSHSPPKCVPVNYSGLNLIHFVLPVISVLLLVLFIFVGIKYKRKTSPDLTEDKIELDNTLAQLTDNNEPLLPLKRNQESTLSLDSLPILKRNRQFDAFVIYHFDTDHDFVTDTLIPQLEEATNLKLKIHSRDFEPGRKIHANIEEAIKSSNNAIVLMSAGFTTSRWCADEFDHCYIEHVDDPAFKLFIVVMEAVKNLPDLTLNMKKVLNEQTYLELGDPDLFTKLCRYLKPDEDSDTNDSD